MTFQIGRTLVLSVTAFAMLSAPVLLNQIALPFVPDAAAMAAKGGNGGENGSGNGGGNGGGNGSDNGGGKSRSESASGNGQSVGKGKKSSTAGELSTAKADGADKERNIKAQLAGLNSLKRNINGLMNSADPRLAGIRQFVVASAQAEAALADARAAEDALNGAKSDYMALVRELGLSGYADYSPSALQTRLNQVESLLSADPSNADLIAEQEALAAALPVLEQSPELAAVYDALAAFTAAEQAAAAAGSAANEDSLRAALLMAANENRRSDAYLTDDIMAWANSLLGVGGSRGLIDDYVASN
jgi:hypothetical protein